MGPQGIIVEIFWLPDTIYISYQSAWRSDGAYGAGRQLGYDVSLAAASYAAWKAASSAYGAATARGGAAVTSNNSIGTPFNPNARGVQIGVDPRTLTPAKDLSTLSPNRLQNAIQYAGDRAIIVDRAGRVLDGHHRW